MESMREKILRGLEKKISYIFRDKTLLDQALVHRSYSYEQASKPVNNECLEFLGDAVLGLAVGHLLFVKYSDYEEGTLSQLKANMVSENSLSQLARKLNLGKFLLLGKGEELSGGRAKNSILADTYEALLAAIYLDGGLEPAHNLVKRHFLPLLPASISRRSLLDFKSRLQEYTQEEFKAIPEYFILKESGPEHQKRFAIGVKLNGEILARGTGKNKKAAEQRAARNALKKLAAVKIDDLAKSQ